MLICNLAFETFAADNLMNNSLKQYEIVYLPDELLGNNPDTPSRNLEAFINSCSNKKVMFPSNKTFVLERQLVIHHVNNIEIDFNGCTFQLPDNLSWTTRYDTGGYVAINAITVHDSRNVTLSNYIIDGNSANISPDKWCTGLWLFNTEGFYSINGSYRNCNYHHIVIYPGTKNLLFTDTFFKDHGGASKPAGISDVFVSNDPSDDFSFINTIVDNSELKDRQGQCFYIAGYNGFIDTVNTNNCSVPLDIRKGTHIANNFTVNNAELILTVQPYPNGSAELANLTASNFIATNIIGQSNGGASGVYIVGCEQCHLDNFKIYLDPTANYSWYGIRIRKYYDNFDVKNVNIKNIEVINSRVAGIISEDLTESTQIKDVKVVGASNSSKGFISNACTANQYIENLIATNCVPYSSKDNMVVLK